MRKRYAFTLIAVLLFSYGALSAKTVALRQFEQQITHTDVIFLDGSVTVPSTSEFRVTVNSANLMPVRIGEDETQEEVVRVGGINNSKRSLTVAALIPQSELRAQSNSGAKILSVKVNGKEVPIVLFTNTENAVAIEIARLHFDGDALLSTQLSLTTPNLYIYGDKVEPGHSLLLEYTLRHRCCTIVN